MTLPEVRTALKQAIAASPNGVCVVYDMLLGILRDRRDEAMTLTELVEAARVYQRCRIVARVEAHKAACPDDRDDDETLADIKALLREAD